MKSRAIVALAAVAVGAGFGVAHSAAASPAADAGAGRAVFVQTNQANGNQIVVYDRAADGSLSRAGTYATGGDGAAAAPGTETDHLASQGSLVYDAAHRLLLAVNAGSDSVSALRVHGDRLELESVVPSGGLFPASIAVHGTLVYVLNSGGSGVAQGFRIAGHRLVRIHGSARALGLANTDPPNFLSSPGQIGFSPDGRQLLVTTKASESTIDVFGVRRDGRLSATPVSNPAATPVPFAFTFAPTGRLVAGEAGASTVSTYELGSDGTLRDARSQADGQVALCWITRVGEHYYVSNTGSNTVSGYTIAADGQPSLGGATGVVATTEPGPIDSTSPPGTALLYVETGGGTVDEFTANADGTLSQLGTVADLPAGIEGIAST
jgi:6-phosphogluconolactonase (cycloisomerase 2 family)